MLSLVKEVTKKVNHPTQIKDGKPVIVTRKATITANYVDPKNEDWLEDALLISGGDSNLAARVFNFGLDRWIKQQETNKLGKTDEFSKGLEKSIAGFIAMGLYTAEQARTMILSNPDAAAKFADQKFEQFVESDVSDFAAYQKDADGKSRFPDVTDVGSDEGEEEVVKE